jgi:Cd2+/Zn2+-exporting ATPase
MCAKDICNSNCDSHCGDAGNGLKKQEILKLSAGALLFAAGLLAAHLFSPCLPGYASLALFVAAYVVLGGGVIVRAFSNITRGEFFDENFLMSVATVGAFAIGEYPEAVGVMLFYNVGELFQSAAVRRSKASIVRLMDIRPDFANLKGEDGAVVKTAAGDVRVGDTVVVKPGEKIPLDGTVTSGVSALDVSALTGESLPKEVGVGDAVLSGSVNINGLLTIAVTKIYSESTASKIIALVEGASAKKAATENFITAFAGYYTPAVVAAAALLAVVPPLFFDGAWADWIKRALIFLVVSCPCALVLSIPMSFFVGIGKAARRGILVKGGNYLEAVSRLDTVVFDKTGTLTKGVFKVAAVRPANGFSRAALLSAAARAEAHSNHPIALSILRECGEEADKDGPAEYSEMPGLGVSAAAGGKTYLAGNAAFMDKMGVAFQPEPRHAGTIVYAAVNGVFAGSIAVADEAKPDGKAAVAALKSRGVRKTVMLSGDAQSIADAVAAEVGMDEACGGLLPHEKAEKTELLIAQKRAGGKLAFVGDGINDAPSLAIADVGIAMGALGSDAAIEAADVVLMTDEVGKLAEAMDIARFTKKIVWQNIAFVLSVKGIFLALGACGAATMWEAVFADVGVALATVLNAVRILRG